MRTPPTCPHTKAQTGFAYLCAKCRSDVGFIAALDVELNAEIPVARLAELYDVKPASTP